MQKICVVEDDENIRDIVLYALRSSGFEAAGFETGADFFASGEKPDLLLLDIMLPGDDGLSVLKRLRSDPRTKALSVIILTAKSTEFDKVTGLDMGADDYITKPFGVMELLSRVNAVLRRTVPKSERDTRLSLGDLSIDNDRREVHVGGENVTLTYKEYELLYFLTLNAGLVMSRNKLMESVWGYDFEGESRTLDMHIRSLRQKLGRAGEMIKTVRNVGYKLSE
jgi:two-component system alkaline phosphatase synthesis response regulator PhoP